MSSRHVPSPRIVTPRLVIRCWEFGDAALLKHAIDASLDHLQPWMSWAKSEPSELSVIEARLARMRDNFLNGREWAYGILDSSEREVLGGLGLHRRGQPDAMEIGYWLRVDVTGRGYATEAVGAVTRAAFEELGVQRLEIRCDPKNVRSAGVPHRLGYRHTRTLENDTTTPDGRPRDTMVWELTAADYQTKPTSGTPR
jgi:RimJ/RimL family protein N-acetyltransferase